LWHLPELWVRRFAGRYRRGKPLRHCSDIPSAARAPGVGLTDHATVLARAQAAVVKIEAGMAWAQRTGVLHEFNQEYRLRRLEAQRRGEGFMGYAQAKARLRRAITKVAANRLRPGGDRSGGLRPAIRAERLDEARVARQTAEA
jgi:hypothetical protein